MLSLAEAERRIAMGELTVGYTFLPRADGTVTEAENEVLADPANPASDATQLFRKNYFGDRLSLTLGPIVMSHNPRSVDGRNPFRGRKGYFDLRETNNEFTLEPYEVLSVSTNERIALGASLGAFTLPRLTHVDSGLLYVPSYIDPYWDGLLQAVIINVTAHRQKLRLAEKIAICRIYCVTGNVDPAVRETFARKSHHFGQTWQRILAEDGEPIPRRKRPAPDSQPLPTRVKTFFVEYGKHFKTFGITASVLAVIGVGAELLKQLGDLKDLTERLKKVEERSQTLQLDAVPKLQQATDRLQTSSPISGAASVSLSAGQARAETTITIDRPLEYTATALAFTPSEIDSKAVARVSRSASDRKKTELTIDVERRNSSANQAINVVWLLLP